MSSPLPRTGTYLRLLRFSLVAGALFDLVTGALLTGSPQLAERLLGLPRPAEPVYFWLLAALLGTLALFYLLAAYDPVSYRGNVAVAILGRAGAGLVLALAGWKSGFHSLWWPASMDLLFAAVHAIFWWPIRR